LISPQGAGGVKAIVFDIGNVLLDWDPRHLYRRVFTDAERMEWFLENICHQTWNREQDRGRSWADAVAERIAAHPDWEQEIRAYDARWHETVAGEIDTNVALLRALKAAQWPLYSITNFSREKFAECLVRYPFMGLFDGIVVSAHDGLMKPEPAIYRLLLDRYGLDAAGCLFIDDVLANCEGAETVGMRALHAPPGFDLAAGLARHGVKITGI
jgi:HAD superfamily hydrolase (TIGR01509 family)